jgi:peroxiredoxin
MKDHDNLTIGLAALATLMIVVPALAITPGNPAPDFTLPDLDGNEHTLSEYLGEGKIVVLEWFNPDCPFIVKHHKNHRTMAETLEQFAEHGVVWLAINSGAPGLQGHGLERNERARKEFAMTFPLLLDPSGEVGKAYGAKTSPHMYVITPEGTVVYNGAIDNDRSAGKLGDTNHVAEALAAVVAGKPVEVAETRPYGCSVKYAD